MLFMPHLAGTRGIGRAVWVGGTAYSFSRQSQQHQPITGVC